jgi:hypothetical protein
MRIASQSFTKMEVTGYKLQTLVLFAGTAREWPPESLKHATCNCLIPVFQEQVYTDIYTHRNEYGILFTQTLPATLTGEVENKMLAINVNYPEPYPFTRLPARRYPPAP